MDRKGAVDRMKYTHKVLVYVGVRINIVNKYIIKYYTYIYNAYIRRRKCLHR